MIASIKGKISELEVDRVVIDTNYIGYEIHISFRTYLSLKQFMSDSQVHLWIHHQITDRSQKLYGFQNKIEKDIFIALKSLSGLGEATALKILSFLTPEEIYQAALKNDHATLEKIPKIKSKTSEKILFELNRNIKKFSSLLDTASSTSPSGTATRDTSILALMQLGFDEKTATKNVDQSMKENTSADAGEIIKYILQKM